VVSDERLQGGQLLEEPKLLHFRGNTFSLQISVLDIPPFLWRIKPFTACQVLVRFICLHLNSEEVRIFTGMGITQIRQRSLFFQKVWFQSLEYARKMHCLMILTNTDFTYNRMLYIFHFTKVQACTLPHSSCLQWKAYILVKIYHSLRCFSYLCHSDFDITMTIWLKMTFKCLHLNVMSSKYSTYI